MSTRRIILRGVHKIIISPIDDITCKITIYEDMGGRWVKLGNSETWNTQDAINEYKEA